jgi:hypothetical protein
MKRKLGRSKCKGEDNDEMQSNKTGCGWLGQIQRAGDIVKRPGLVNYIMTTEVTRAGIAWQSLRKPERLADKF